MLRIVADLGNSRLKWGRLDRRGQIEQTLALPIDDAGAWARAWHRWDLASAGSSWSISTVNPPVAQRLADFLHGMGVRSLHWYTSAADVPVRHALDQPAATGTDRAFAVLAATELQPPGQPGMVVSCGSAIVVERIAASGIWEGGAIAAGLGMSARAMHLLTAQLPLVAVPDTPAPWGADTRSAMASGLFWGTVGAIRELVTRQAAGLTPVPWLVWTGGEASLFAPWIGWDGARIVPDLVLHGLARTVSAPPERRRRR